MIYKYRWLSQALDDMSQEIGYVYSLFGHKAAQRAEARIHDRIIIAIVKLRTASTHCFCRRRCLSAKHRSGTSEVPGNHVIISHAITNKMPLISSDRKFEFYRSQGLDFIFNKK